MLVAAAVAGLVAVSSPGAGALPAGVPAPTVARTDTVTADLNIVHGIPGLAVDIYLYRGITSLSQADQAATFELPDVQFGREVDLNRVDPGFVTPDPYLVDVVAAGGNPDDPLLLNALTLTAGQVDSVVAYQTADGAGIAGPPALGVFTDDTASIGAAGRLTVVHVAAAPAFRLKVDGMFGRLFHNGQQRTELLPPSVYLFALVNELGLPVFGGGHGMIQLRADTDTEVFVVGTFPEDFRILVLNIPAAR